MKAEVDHYRQWRPMEERELQVQLDAETLMWRLEESVEDRKRQRDEARELATE